MTDIPFLPLYFTTSSKSIVLCVMLTLATGHRLTFQCHKCHTFCLFSTLNIESTFYGRIIQTRIYGEGVYKNNQRTLYDMTSFFFFNITDKLRLGRPSPKPRPEGPAHIFDETKPFILPDPTAPRCCPAVIGASLIWRGFERLTSG